MTSTSGWPGVPREPRQTCVRDWLGRPKYWWVAGYRDHRWYSAAASTPEAAWDLWAQLEPGEVPQARSSEDDVKPAQQAARQR